MWRATVLTLFPEVFPGVLGASASGASLRGGLWELEARNLRDYGVGRRREVDGRPYGGGAGMVLRADVLARALDAVWEQDERSGGVRRRAVALGAGGRPWDQERARELSLEGGVVLLCGRYEGVDERLFEAREVEEASVGDFVVSGGESAATLLLESAVRLLPGAARLSGEESFSCGLLGHAQYTTPREFEGLGVPEELLGGDHAAAASWRRSSREERTRRRRGDMWRRRLEGGGGEG